MSIYMVKLARVEHQVYTMMIEAGSEKEAESKVGEVMEADDFDWDDYEVVHADEFITDTQEIEK